MGSGALAATSCGAMSSGQTLLCRMLHGQQCACLECLETFLPPEEGIVVCMPRCLAGCWQPCSPKALQVPGSAMQHWHLAVG